MATVNSASLRDEFDAYKVDIASLRKEGKITKEFDVVLTGVNRHSIVTPPSRRRLPPVARNFSGGWR